MKKKKKKQTTWGDWWSDSIDHSATFARIGNLWLSWIFWAIVLEESAYCIDGRSFLRRGSRSTKMPMVLCVRAMLLGYAVECALKARWLRMGNRLVVDGKFKSIPGVGEHNLLQLSTAVRFVPTEVEKNVLARLSKFALFAGRYPLGGHPKPATDGHLKTGHHT